VLNLLSLLLPVAGAAPVTLSAAEVARHDSAEDCWLILEDVVYDITPFVAAHPGGDVMLRGCGKDATWFFQERGDGGGHSQAASEMTARFALGGLGESVEVEGIAREAVHPHDVRLEGSRVGLFPSAGVGPARSVALRVGHQISTDADLPSGIGVQLGYSLGWLDLLVSDYRAPGLGAVEVKVSPLHQQRGAPLSVGLSGGGGFAAAADAPAVFGQLVVERAWLDRRLTARANGTAATSPGVDDSAAASAGVGVELRPLPIHSVFAEVQTPFADPSALVWAAGARLHTRGHAFSLYVSSTPVLSPWELAGPTPAALAVGGAFERAFRL